MNESPECVISLPHSLLSEILYDWLLLMDVCVLDSACCNHSIRQQFLEVLASFSVRSKVYIGGHKYERFRWLVLRNIQLTEVVFDYSGERAEGIECLIIEWRIKFLRNWGKTLTRVDLCECVGGIQEEFIEIGHLCSNLNNVLVNNSDLGGLRKLQLFNCANLAETVFEGISCPMLHTLGISKIATDAMCCVLHRRLSHI